MIDHEGLMDLMEIGSMEELKRSYRESVEESVVRQDRKREPMWTKSIAVGSEEFVEETKAHLVVRAIGREVSGGDEVYQLREGEISYKAIFGGENSGLRPKNTYFWGRSE